MKIATHNTIGNVLVVLLGAFLGFSQVVSAENDDISGPIAADWVNVNYARSIDLSKSYVKESVLVEAKNVADKPISDYFFQLPDGLGNIPDVAVISASLMDQSMLIEAKPVGHQLYKLSLPIPIAPDSVTNFRILYVYHSVFKAIPDAIDLADTQTLLVKLNKFNYSPYHTESYTINFEGIRKGQEMELPGSQVVVSDYNDDVPELKGNVADASLVYGPAFDIKPRSISAMGLLIEHNKPLGKVETLERSIWVPSSDINQFLIEEYYELTNEGAGLKNGFLRVEWLRGRYENLRNHFGLSHLEIPMVNGQSFSDYYFTDKVGMVTTHKSIKNILIFQPRFPLFGDWKYNFTFGWNEYVDQHIHQLNDDKDIYLVKVPLLNSINDLTYNNVNLNFYLPENAEFINVSSPIEFNSVSVSNEFSYLDVSQGHNKVQINYSNLFDDLSKIDVIVMYKYTKIHYWYKILKISGFIFVGLISYYLLNMINISID